MSALMTTNSQDGSWETMNRRAHYMMVCRYDGSRKSVDLSQLIIRPRTRTVTLSWVVRGRQPVVLSWGEIKGSAKLGFPVLWLTQANNCGSQMVITGFGELWVGASIASLTSDASSPAGGIEREAYALTSHSTHHLALVHLGTQHANHTAIPSV